MFHPNMRSIVEGFSPNGGPKWRSWNGMLADVWKVTGEAGASGEYVSPHARLFTVIDETQPGALALSDQPGVTPGPTGRLSYIPPGLRIWSLAPSQTRLRHLDLHVDLTQFTEKFGLGPADERFLTPRLMFDNPRIEALAQLLAEDCVTSTSHDLYGEGIATAMLVELFGIAQQAENMRGQLSPRRLKLATHFLAEHCYDSLRLEDIAGLVGLSPSYFSSAFKASTGLTPHQWQMQERITRVKTLLVERQASISEVAALCGFADQAHLTRVFKRHCGLTPAAWLRLSNV
ncbi:AraC family transcriptional regulator [Devosia sp.]|uniref:helix-turn-helix transcriptional regulator n=1 Tax=Devosia sp. TaxID=1871048 RepID=UPI001ACDA484|nr:AraC family transcriptional regulator [Devosia sp.]MBN9334314.1 helix-turn-helix transcriptional regulator [Devosia sp.]